MSVACKRDDENPNQHSQTKLIALPHWWRKLFTLQCFSACWILLPFFLLICCHIPQFYTELNSRVEFCSFWFQLKKKDDTLSLTMWIRKKMYKCLDLYMHWALLLVEKMCASNTGNGKYFLEKKEPKKFFPFNVIARTCWKRTKNSWNTCIAQSECGKEMHWDSHTYGVNSEHRNIEYLIECFNSIEYSIMHNTVYSIIYTQNIRFPVAFHKFSTFYSKSLLHWQI